LTQKTASLPTSDQWQEWEMGNCSLNELGIGNWELGSRLKFLRAKTLGAIGNWVRGKSFSRKTFASHWELGSRLIRFCAQKFYFRRDWELGIGIYANVFAEQKHLRRLGIITSA
jgi:hypothetical protein